MSENEPPILRKTHGDWPFILRWIPRRLTAFDWGAPKQVAGNQKNATDAGFPKPIGEPGTYQVSVFPYAPWWAKPIAWYLAFTLKNGRHFRLGARWDDVDAYTQWPSIASRPPDKMERDTSS
jgi:hypothetical protein